MAINLDTIISHVCETVRSHRLDGEGRYARWLWQDADDTRQLGLNEYGCADAANILYTIGEFPSASQSREQWIKTLQELQNPESGLFAEATHHTIHTTAHCIAALELFDAKPQYPLKGLMQFADKAGLYTLLDNLDWENNAWPQSHQGAGIYAAMVLTDSVDESWRDAYFAWMWENADPETGFWKKGTVCQGTAPLYQFMAGGFHYLFNHEYAHMPIRYPEKMLDSCLEMYETSALPASFGQDTGFIEVDWVYCINRARRQTPYRYHDCQKALTAFAKTYTDFLSSIDVRSHDGFNDLHMLFGSVCCLAELQQALPGMLRSKTPLKLVLDRRPFI